jgi:hypothetical protein
MSEEINQFEIKPLRTEFSKTFLKGSGVYKKQFFTIPIHYKNEEDSFEEVQIDFANLDDKYLVQKNKVSCGFRKDKKLWKYVGLRYDYNHQFESTFKSIVLNGKEMIEDVNAFSEITKLSPDKLLHVLPNGLKIESHLGPISFRNFVKAETQVQDFSITEELFLKGLSFSNKKEANKYIPDECNCFNIVDEQGEFKFKIVAPIIFNANGEIIGNIDHSLEEVDGKLLYTKTPSLETKDILAITSYPILIDSNTYYSQANDGWVQRSVTLTTEPNWNNLVNDSTGTAVSSSPASAVTHRAWRSISKSNITRSIIRSFFEFDTSSIPDGYKIYSAKFSIYLTEINNDSAFVLLKGTQGSTLSIADYSAFTGNPLHSDESITIGNISEYTNITIKSEELDNAINKTGLSKFCIRQYSKDYLNVDIGTSNVRHDASGNYSESESNKPMLEVEFGMTSTGSFTGNSKFQKIIITQYKLLQENGSAILLEDGGFLLTGEFNVESSFNANTNLKRNVTEDFTGNALFVKSFTGDARLRHSNISKGIVYAYGLGELNGEWTELKETGYNLTSIGTTTKYPITSYFPGTSILRNNSNHAIGTGDFTWSIWLLPLTDIYGTNEDRVIIGRGTGTSNASIVLTCNGTFPLSLRHYNGASWVNETLASSSGIRPYGIQTNYRHLVVKRENGVWSSYLDSEKIGEVSLDKTLQAGISFGARHFEEAVVSNSAWKGKLLNPVEWNRALLDEEIINLTSLGKEYRPSEHDFKIFNTFTGNSVLGKSTHSTKLTGGAVKCTLIEDSYIANGSAATINYSDSVTVKVYSSFGTASGIVKFSIPSYVGKVFSLFLKAKLTRGMAYDVSLKKIKRPDVEMSEVTWNSYKTGSNWQTAGALGADDIGSTITQKIMSERLVDENLWDIFEMNTGKTSPEIVEGVPGETYTIKLEHNNGLLYYNSKEAVIEEDRPEIWLGYFRDLHEDSFNANTNLKRNVTEDFTGNALFVKSFTGDSNLSKSDISNTFAGNASLKKVIPTSLTGDASLRRIVAEEFTGDANLKLIIVREFNGNSSLLLNTAMIFYGDANLLINKPDTFTSNANLKGTVNHVFTVNSNLLSTNISDSFTGNSSLKKILLTGFYGDSFISEPTLDFAGIVTTQKLIKNTFAGTVDLDRSHVRSVAGSVNLVNQLEQTFSGDAALMNTYSMFVSGDASLKRIVPEVFTGDANLYGPEFVTFTGDSNLLKTDLPETFTGDAAFFYTFPNVFYSDANLLGLEETYFLGYSSFAKTKFETFNGDANLVSSIPDSFKGDSYLSKVLLFAGKVNLEGVSKESFAGATLLEYFNLRIIAGKVDLVYLRNESFRGNSNLKKVDIASSFVSDAALMKRVSASYTGDASLITQITKGWTADSNLLRNYEEQFTGDANLYGSESLSFSGDSNLKVLNIENSFTADSILLKKSETSLTVDANLYKTEFYTITADASLLSSIDTSFTADANLKKEYAFTADANLKASVITSFTGDSVLDILVLDVFAGKVNIAGLGRITYSGKVTLEALRANVQIAGFADLFRVYSDTFTGDAKLVATTSGTFTGNSAIVNNYVDSFTGNSALMTRVVETFTGDSCLVVTIYNDYTGDASLKKVVADVFTGDSILQEQSFEALAGIAVLEFVGVEGFSGKVNIESVSNRGWGFGSSQHPLNTQL